MSVPWILLYLSLSIFWASLLLFGFVLSAHLPSPLPILPTSQHFICTVRLLCRLNWDSSFLHLRALTYVLWHALSQFYVVIDFYPLRLLPFCLNRHKPFCPADSSGFPTDLWQSRGVGGGRGQKGIEFSFKKWGWTWKNYLRFLQSKQQNNPNPPPKKGQWRRMTSPTELNLWTPTGKTNLSLQSKTQCMLPIPSWEMIVFTSCFH